MSGGKADSVRRQKESISSNKKNGGRGEFAFPKNQSGTDNLGCGLITKSKKVKSPGPKENLLHPQNKGDGVKKTPVRNMK